jgi:hypothetical protein
MFWKAVAAHERLEKLRVHASLVQQQQEAAERALQEVLTSMGVDTSKAIWFDYAQERVVPEAEHGRPA